MTETLYLIDGHAQIFRAYFAIRGGMRSPVTSEPTHAVFGWTGMLLKLFSQCRPHYVVVAVDMPGKTFRDEMYTEYKGTRDSTPEDLTAQVPRILEVTDLFGLPVIGVPGFEADDVIATITRRVLEDPGCASVNIRIVSKDKDLEQLLCDRVAMFDIHTDTMLDEAWLLSTRGIRPDQVIDLLALTGDTVDNVPGVEGIGPKTAAQLIQQYGSIEGILEHLDEIKGKRRENLEKARTTLPLSRALVTLRSDAEVPFSLEAARVRPLQVQKIIPVFQQLGFNRYQDDLRALAAPTTTTAPPGLFDALPETEGGLPAPTAIQTTAEEAPAPAAALEQGAAHRLAAEGKYRAITTVEELRVLVEQLRNAPLVSVDTETTGLSRRAELCGVSLAWQPGEAVYVPTRSPEPATHLDTDTALGILRPLLEDNNVPKCGHNLKFDAGVLLRHGVRLRGVVFDSMLASVLADPSHTAQLDHLAAQVLQYAMVPISEVIGTGDNQGTIEEASLETVVPYAAEDADIALRLFHKLSPRVEELGMAALLREVEAPLTVVLSEMEHNGILCDPVELQRQGEALGARVEELKEEIFGLCEGRFDLNSTQQLAEVLFDRLGMPAQKRTKTGRSTDIEVLEKLAALENWNDPRSRVPGLVIEYRQLQKLISTYLGNLVASVDKHTGRIHSTFHQLVTATGRLASHHPNLQNIPIRTEIGRQIRRAFLAPPGAALVCADYSQIELRLLAHLSRDEALTTAFAEDQDIHSAVAAQVFGVDLAAVSREQRAQAKTINFGIIYGITPYGLARRIEGLDVNAAKKLIEEYRLRFSGIDRFLQQCVQEALEKGYVCTILGRRRAIPEVHSNDRNRRGLGERLAINSVVQGSAADLIKAAMVDVQARIDRDRLPLKMLLQIHDELVLECPASAAEECAAAVREEMERAMTLDVPLRADAGYGSDWFSAK